MKSFSMLTRSEPISRLQAPLYILVVTLAAVAVVAGLAVPLLGALPQELRVNHQLISATALLSVGLAYVTMQFVVKPRPKELLRRLMVAAAFILWGIDQLLPLGPLAGGIGDLVILLYVVELALVVRDQLPPQPGRAATPTWHDARCP